MILVDSSVWINYFRGTVTHQTDTLDSLLSTEPLAIGDLIQSCPTGHECAPKVRPPASQARHGLRQRHVSSSAALAGAARRSAQPTARQPERGRPARQAPHHHCRAERCQTKREQLLDSTTHRTRPPTAARPTWPPSYVTSSPRGAMRPDEARAALPHHESNLAESPTSSLLLAIRGFKRILLLTRQSNTC